MTESDIEKLENSIVAGFSLTKAVAEAMGWTDFYVFANMDYAIPPNATVHGMVHEKLTPTDVVNWVARINLEAFVKQLLWDIDYTVEVNQKEIALLSDDGHMHITDAYQLVLALLTVRKEVLYKAALKVFYNCCNYKESIEVVGNE